MSIFSKLFGKKAQSQSPPKQAVHEFMQLRSEFMKAAFSESKFSPKHLKDAIPKEIDVARKLQQQKKFYQDAVQLDASAQKSFEQLYAVVESLLADERIKYDESIKQNLGLYSGQVYFVDENNELITLQRLFTNPTSDMLEDFKKYYNEHWAGTVSLMNKCLDNFAADSQIQFASENMYN